MSWNKSWKRKITTQTPQTITVKTTPTSTPTSTLKKTNNCLRHKRWCKLLSYRFMMVKNEDEKNNKNQENQQKKLKEKIFPFFRGSIHSLNFFIPILHLFLHSFHSFLSSIPLLHSFLWFISSSFFILLFLSFCVCVNQTKNHSEKPYQLDHWRVIEKNLTFELESIDFLLFNSQNWYHLE